MTAETVYRSSNGDDWSVELDGTGGGIVVHRANAGSGGAVTRMPIAEFIERGGGGPEVQAVRDAVARGAGR